MFESVVSSLDLRNRLTSSRSELESLSVYCNSCETHTRNWDRHKLDLEHLRNNSDKMPCHFCPRWLCGTGRKMRDHVREVHSDLGFTCSVSRTCRVKLMRLDEMLEHLQSKHHVLERVAGPRMVHQKGCFILPRDLRKLSCQLCGRVWLCQDQQEVSRHLRQEHPGLPQSQHQVLTLLECRLCPGLQFRCEQDLVEHCGSQDLVEHCGSQHYEDGEQGGSGRDVERSDKIVRESNSKRITCVKKVNKSYKVYRKTKCEDKCPFCLRCPLTSLESHLRTEHADQLFSCDMSCGNKFKSVWRADMFLHLSSVLHRTPCNSMIRLPASLAMVRCTGCEQGVFLAKKVGEVEQEMEDHVVRRHQGARVLEMFQLACRGCSSVFSMQEEENWKEHLNRDHSRGQECLIKLLGLW